MNLNISMNANTMKNIALAGLSLLSVGTLGYAVHVSKKASDMVKKFDGKVDAATDKLSEDISNRVCDSILEESVKKAVEGRVQNEIVKASRTAVSNVKSEMNAQIRNVVDHEWARVKVNVENDLMARVKELDISEMEKEAVTAAKEKLLDRVNETVDDAIDDLRRRYNNKVDDYITNFDKRHPSVKYVTSSYLGPTDAAIDALFTAAIDVDSDYKRYEYAEKIIELAEEYDDSDCYIYAIKALKEIYSKMTSTYYAGEIMDKIVELGKEV